ncbi:hypothetical protein [Longivirga aurantiaca]|uniref:Uncharacterized protein n=1 Tax=Longivirga aurantiaca TaxID=1837743 RepID=A0ABW1SYI9_9ACTN
MHKEARDVAPARAVEEALRVLPGVLEASVSVGLADDQGTEVHLVLGDDGDQAAVAHAVHRMLQLQYGVGLDHDGVELVMDVTDAAVAQPPGEPAGGAVGGASADVLDLGVEIDGLLAQLDRRSGRSFEADVLSAAVRHPAGATPVPEPRAADRATDEGAEVRLSVTRLSIVVDRQRAHAAVTLRGPAGEVRGTADAASADSAVLEAVALATLRALASLRICGDEFGVIAVSTPHVGDVDVAVVQVECRRHLGTDRLTGASEVRDDVHRAVIRATLDAVNRRLRLLTLAP